ncbi:uncharacterized protein LOC121141094 [Mesocricetus auratus]|uniref:Uncharacterized protein LOC121141094 n=1 Tax=Mesocricetus auratus TaxID=10036 RepID=A0ABM2XMB9_MESAU|nr:uncharacterized protein LOC121141094 [Mesocricetus auratus]
MYQNITYQDWHWVKGAQTQSKHSVWRCWWFVQSCPDLPSCSTDFPGQKQEGRVGTNGARVTDSERWFIVHGSHLGSDNSESGTRQPAGVGAGGWRKAAVPGVRRRHLGEHTARFRSTQSQPAAAQHRQLACSGPRHPPLPRARGRPPRRLTWTSAASFFSCASACAFASSSTWLSWRRGPKEDGAKAETQGMFLIPALGR